MENEKEQFFSLENSADSDETSSGENNIAYTRKLSLDTDIFSGLPEFVFVRNTPGSDPIKKK